MAERAITMNELINVKMNDEQQQVVSARDLYTALEIKQRFSAWFENNSKNLIEDVDFTTVLTDTEVKNNGGTQLRQLQDYHLTLDASKQIAMMSASEKGKQIRMYFIEVEKQFNSPEMMMARSLQYANQTLLQYDKQIKELSTTIEEQKPKVEMAEKLLKADDANISMKDFAKVLANYGVDVGRNTLMKGLRNSGWLLRDNTPSSKAMSRGIFNTHETVINTSFGTRIQTVTTITPKGQKFLIERVTRNEAV